MWPFGKNVIRRVVFDYLRRCLDTSHEISWEEMDKEEEEKEEEGMRRRRKRRRRR
jgi:hypothetical protein